MATKHNCPCLDKAADDEPIFVLRAQDASSPHTIRVWLSLNPTLPVEKVAEALSCIAAMTKWLTRKIAD